MRPQIAAQVQEMALENVTTFAGLRSDVARLMLGAMDVFVFPSHYEGLGLVLIEAQAAGLPCVISDVVPTEADLVPEIISRLPLSASPATWAQAIVEMHHNPLPRSTAMAIVENSHFNQTVSTQKLTSVYQASTGRHK